LHKKNQTFLFGDNLGRTLRAKVNSRGFARKKNALELCAPLKFCGPMLRLALEKLICFPNRVFSLGNKIFLVEEKRTCFQLEVGLSTEAASFS